MNLVHILSHWEVFDNDDAFSAATNRKRPLLLLIATIKFHSFLEDIYNYIILKSIYILHFPDLSTAPDPKIEWKKVIVKTYCTEPCSLVQQVFADWQAPCFTLIQFTQHPFPHARSLTKKEA